MCFACPKRRFVPAQCEEWCERDYIIAPMRDAKTQRATNDR
jgi:hypothetical protein